MSGQADKQLSADATDTISAVRWSPVGHHLAAGSWDGKVRIYEVKADGSSRGVAMLSSAKPIFSCDWSKDGSIIAGAGADKSLHLLDAASGATSTIASGHDAPVHSVRFVSVPSASGSAPILATGSWDRTVRYWDLRTGGTKPVAALQCAERVYAMDSAADLLVVATAERHIHLVSLANPGAIARTAQSPLKHQTTDVAAFPDGKGWATASIEGRCGINSVSEETSRIAKEVNFSFRCHRDLPDANKVVNVWAVNAVNFHPVHATTFSTAGADGTFHFWDRVAHARLRAFPPAAARSGAAAITSTHFSHDGALFAYAVGYDWSMGYAKNTPDYPNRLMVHAVSDEEVRPKKK